MNIRELSTYRTKDDVLLHPSDMVAQPATKFAQRNTCSTAMRPLRIVDGSLTSPKVPNDLDPCILLVTLVQLESILVAVQPIILLGWQTQSTSSCLVRRVRKSKQAHCVPDNAFLARFHLLGDVYGEAEPLVHFENQELAVERGQSLINQIWECRQAIVVG